ncbi:MAG: RnfH family protein, partial [Comamonadaceae bacterium]
MIIVTLCCAIGPGQVDEEVLQLREGSTLRDAVMASGLRGRHAL